MGYSQTIIQGNLGADPEMKFTQQGRAVCNFRVAVNLGNNRVDWYRVTAWEALAERCNQYLRKGATVLVIGQMQPAAAYLDRAGQPAAQLELTAFNVQFLGGSTGGNGTAEKEPDSLEDIPF